MTIAKYKGRMFTLGACIFSIMFALFLMGLSACQGEGTDKGSQSAEGDEAAENYSGPLPFLGIDRPLSQMHDNGDGTVTDEDGVRYATYELAVYFGMIFSEETVMQVLEGEGAVTTDADRRKLLDASNVEFNVPEGMTPEEAMRSALEEAGFEVTYVYWHKHLDTGEADVNVPDGITPEEAAEVLLGIDGVNLVEPTLRPEHGMRMFEDSEAAWLTAGSVDLGRQGDPETDFIPPIDLGEYHLNWHRFNEAFNYAQCSGNVTVAVLDTGAPPDTLSDIASNIDYDRMYDATGGDGYDTFGHGTAVSSVISAVAGDDSGLTGCSYNAQILPIRIAQGGEFEKNSQGKYIMQPLWDAFDYLLDLDDAPEVVNMSFGASSEEMEGGAGSTELIKSYMSHLFNKGCVLVAASGNDGGFDPRELLWPGMTNKINYPASSAFVISVGALGAPLFAQPPAFGSRWTGIQKASFSNTASSVDLTAFGEDIHAWSRSIIGIWGVASETGTSFAAPQVSSAAALVKALHESWNHNKVKTALVSTADKLPSMGSYNYTSAYGYGALNALGAVLWTPPSGGSTGGQTWAQFIHDNPDSGYEIDESGYVRVDPSTYVCYPDGTAVYMTDIKQDIEYLLLGAGTVPM